MNHSCVLYPFREVSANPQNPGRSVLKGKDSSDSKDQSLLAKSANNYVSSLYARNQLDRRIDRAKEAAVGKVRPSLRGTTPFPFSFSRHCQLDLCSGCLLEGKVRPSLRGTTPFPFSFSRHCQLDLCSGCLLEGKVRPSLRGTTPFPFSFSRHCQLDLCSGCLLEGKVRPSLRGTTPFPFSFSRHCQLDLCSGCLLEGKVRPSLRGTTPFPFSFSRHCQLDLCSGCLLEGKVRPSLRGTTPFPFSFSRHCQLDLCSGCLLEGKLRLIQHKTEIALMIRQEGETKKRKQSLFLCAQLEHLRLQGQYYKMAGTLMEQQCRRNLEAPIDEMKLMFEHKFNNLPLRELEFHDRTVGKFVCVSRLRDTQLTQTDNVHKMSGVDFKEMNQHLPEKYAKQALLVHTGTFAKETKAELEELEHLLTNNVCETDSLVMAGKLRTLHTSVQELQLNLCNRDTVGVYYCHSRDTGGCAIVSAVILVGCAIVTAVILVGCANVTAVILVDAANSPPGQKKWLCGPQCSCDKNICSSLEGVIFILSPGE
uniref:Uncharacterized protein n=1 Tax=Timema poppense TaxID=170557 RepID=A0A7R9DJA1_TIMPO|nr:unnamed protein product [Timema poppensis]